MTKVYMKFTNKIFFFIWVAGFFGIFLSLFLFLLFVELDMDGERVIHARFGKHHPYVEYPLPLERVSEMMKEGNRSFLRLSGDPVYVNVHTPRRIYEKLFVTITYRVQNIDIVEFGPLADIFSGAFDLTPLANEKLSALDWNVLHEGDVLLYQKESTFESLADFWSNTPPIEQIATYRMDFDKPFRLNAKIQTLQQEQHIPVTLKGHHRFVTYVRNHSLELQGEVIDINQTAGKDDVEWRVYNERGEMVFVERLEDDGITDESIHRTMREIQLKTPVLEEGVYMIELVGTSDILWKELRTRQSHFVALQSLHIVENARIPITLFTNVNDFAFSTSASSGLQTIHVNDQSVVLETVGVTQRLQAFPAKVNELRFSSVPLRIITEGYIGFWEEALFVPKPLAFTARLNVEERGIQYILATTTDTTIQDDWQTTTLDMPLASIIDEHGNLRFAFSLQGIGEDGYLDISTITLRFVKQPRSWKELPGLLHDRLFSRL